MIQRPSTIGPPGPARHRGLTLFELTTVLTVVFILALMAFYSSRALVERTKVGRVREEHRLLARALQNYNVDYADFPDSTIGLEVLVRPTAYMGSVPQDPFQPGGGTYVYLRCKAVEGGCVLISPGPDGDFDLPTELWSLADTSHIAASQLPPGARFTDRSMASFAGTTGPAPAPKPVSEAQLAVLRTYMRLAQYDPEKGPDGDIITFVR